MSLSVAIEQARPISACEKVHLCMELLNPTPYTDDNGVLVTPAPLITQEQARKLLGIE